MILDYIMWTNNMHFVGLHYMIISHCMIQIALKIILDDNTSKVRMANNSSRPCNTSTAVRWCVALGMEEDCIGSQAPQQSVALEEGEGGGEGEGEEEGGEGEEGGGGGEEEEEDSS